MFSGQDYGREVSSEGFPFAAAQVTRASDPVSFCGLNLKLSCCFTFEDTIPQWRMVTYAAPNKIAYIVFVGEEKSHSCER